MVFTSPVFVYYFLPVVFLGYLLCPKGARNLYLALSSYVFYGWWNPSFLPLLLASTLIDYQCGRVITAPGAGGPRRRAALTISIVANLSLLGFFKYYLFLAENANLGLERWGQGGLPLWNVVLPVGISFYTFQSMSYSIDLYRGQARPARSFVDFATYVALFPQLIAGPIIRYHELAEQLRERSQSWDAIARGSVIFALGFAKKVLLANNLAPIADAVFAADAPPWHIAWVGVAAYAFQIYFDFSGYSDMAIGLGLLFGFRFPQNFDDPYKAESITDFWRRWHLSLSGWLRDYLYIPLGGNRKGWRRTTINLAATMLLGGLWHGAEWRFLAWGGVHGALLGLERVRGKKSHYFGLPRPLRIGCTFVLILVTWVFFRSRTLRDAFHLLGSMFLLRPAGLAGEVVAVEVYSLFPLCVLIAAAAVTWSPLRTRDICDPETPRRFTPALVLGVIALFAWSLLELSVQSFNPFLYFQF